MPDNARGGDKRNRGVSISLLEVARSPDITIQASSWEEGRVGGWVVGCGEGFLDRAIA